MTFKSRASLKWLATDDALETVVATTPNSTPVEPNVLSISTFHFLFMMLPLQRLGLNYCIQSQFLFWPSFDIHNV